ncbi:hypothetical protein AOLI_G00328480, partial [Acnodon oligacanthus]
GKLESEAADFSFVGLRYHSFAPVCSACTNSRQTWSCFTGSRVSISRSGVSSLRALPGKGLATDTEDCEARATLGRSGWSCCPHFSCEGASLKTQMGKCVHVPERKMEAKDIYL